MATEFNQEFIERRMEEHRLRMHELEYRMIEEIIAEIQALPKRKPRTGYLFDDPLEIGEGTGFEQTRVRKAANLA